MWLLGQSSPIRRSTWLRIALSSHDIWAFFPSAIYSRQPPSNLVFSPPPHNCISPGTRRGPERNSFIKVTSEF